MIERVRLRPHLAIAIDEALTNPKLLGTPWRCTVMVHVVDGIAGRLWTAAHRTKRKIFASIAGKRSHQLIACANYGPSLVDVVANRGWRLALPVTQHY